MANLKYQGQKLALTIGQPATVELPPRIVRLRLTGFLFESAKTFLLPSAMRGIRELIQIYHDRPDAKVLVTGHTDTVGPDDYNRGLSMERADAISAYLTDDAKAWMAWYRGKACSDHWGAREDGLMATAVGYASFDEWCKKTGKSGDPAREALITEYMSLDGTTLPATAGKPVTHGCGPWHQAVATGPNVDKQENRRVEVFFFEGPITPPAKPLCPFNGCPDYPEWVRNSQETVDVGVERTQTPPKIVSFFGRLADYDTETVEAHSLLLPKGRDALLHWELTGATRLRVVEQTLEGATRDLPLPNGGSIAFSTASQLGQVQFTPADDATYSASASGPDGDAKYFRDVFVDVYQPTGSQLSLSVGEDCMTLREGASVGRGPMLGFVKDPPSSLGIKATRPGLLDIKAATQTSPFSGDSDATNLRAHIKKIIRLMSGFGLSTAAPFPADRKEAYLDLVSWDSAGRTAMDSSTPGASSCGMLIRNIWWLAGARGGDLDLDFKENTILDRLLAFAGKAAHPPSDFMQPGQTGFKPDVGDVIFVNRPGSRHIFTIAGIVPQANNCFDMYSVDGGAIGPNNEDTPCNGIWVAKRGWNPRFALHIPNNAPPPLKGTDDPKQYPITGHYFTPPGSTPPFRPISRWIKIDELRSQFSAAPIDLERNRDNVDGLKPGIPYVAPDANDGNIP